MLRLPAKGIFFWELLHLVVGANYFVERFFGREILSWSAQERLYYTLWRKHRIIFINLVLSGTADGWVKGYTFDLEEGLEEVSAINVDSAIYSLDTSDNYHICALDTRQIQVCWIDSFRFFNILLVMNLIHCFGNGCLQIWVVGSTVDVTFQVSSPVVLVIIIS